MKVGLKHMAATLVFILGFSISLNLYLYFEGYYKKAQPEIQTLMGDSSDVFQVNKSMFPMELETTVGNIRVPVGGVINVFVPQYVNCPDICHIETMIMLYVMNKSLEEGWADRVVWITVEVDPWNTTEEGVREYMEGVAGPLLDKGVTWIWVLDRGAGLTKLWGQLGIMSQKDSETGLVGHTAGFYIVDENGFIMYYIKPKTTAIGNAWEKPRDVAEGLYKILRHLALEEHS
ncbi:MAG: SCO family protein [Desulfurococcales archaeon]|nr:SCO family protein [Desulfurococcales archaeon]MCE4605180.1 SCO family protein [Desulfurococcales archaeon]